MTGQESCIGGILFVPLFIFQGVLLFIGQSISLKIFSEIRMFNKELCAEIAGGYSPDALLGHTRTLASAPMMWDLMKVIYYRRDPNIITQKRWVRFVIVYASALVSITVMIATLLYCFVLNVFF